MSARTGRIRTPAGGATPTSLGRARIRPATWAVLLALGMAACQRPAVLGGPPVYLDRSAILAASPRPDRTVVLISVDGLAPRVMADTETPTLDALAAQGTVAVRADTVVPSFTLPSHASMISGVDPGRHGVDWNGFHDDRLVESPTVFTYCRNFGLRCGLFAGKRKFAQFALFEMGVQRFEYVSGADSVLDEALDWLDEREADFVMIHLAEVDLSGHLWGWGSGGQRNQIRQIDALLGVFLDELRDRIEGRLTVIVTADHGGEGRRHGSDSEWDTRIPWIAWGDGVPPGGRIPLVSTMDTAATIISMLGLPVPSDWLGQSLLPLPLRSDARGR